MDLTIKPKALASLGRFQQASWLASLAGVNRRKVVCHGPCSALSAKIAQHYKALLLSAPAGQAESAGTELRPHDEALRNLLSHP